MNFFETLAATSIKDLTIQMKQDDKGTITVFLTPKSTSEDSALKGLKPIYLTGTPQDIDLEFFQIISKPLEDTQKVFSNIEAFEAQKAEVLKATEEKKNAAKNKKAETKNDDDDNEENPSSDDTPTIKPIKEIKVNNEKILKEFIVSIKNDNLSDHKEKLQELIGNLSIAESIKPAMKKIVSDLETSIKKEESIAIARAKFGFTAPVTSETIIEEEEIVSTPLTTKESFSTREKQSDLKELKEIVVNSPNVILATIPGPETVLQKVEEVVEIIPQPEIPPAPIYYTEEIDVLEMIDQTFSYEQYIAATWTDAQLVEKGKAKWSKTTVQKEVIQNVVPLPSVPEKLSYSFPKPFDQD